eukprot:CAMPEP_0202826326 /NCGR_PEP_ID=MMETSP1389-20130828/13541_1 /ASSEMBLY_ACC=CAM_ASM_000865 /TAXON_ID=302021 /ORGANISM="Rhodomonas sp., Strain CCMP768" /LENGTH=98 /DNA_ID=CAMNT_0049499613 /DNA_START=1 /DNA_END=294 /DNA_ORIENTATION=-
MSIEALSQMVHGALEKVPAHAREQVLSAVMNATRQAQTNPQGMPDMGPPQQRPFGQPQPMQQQQQWGGPGGKPMTGKRGPGREGYDSDSSEDGGGQWR